MALSVLLLCCAALLTRTFAQLNTVDPGFSGEGVMAFDLSPSPGRFGGAAQTRAFFDRVLDEVRTLPRVDAVAAGTTVPFTRTGWWFPLARRADGAPDRAMVLVAVVSGGYFDALRIPLVSGRAFTDVEHRNPSPVAIVNEPLARLLGAGTDRVRYGDREIEIVGVAGGVRQRRLADPAPPTLYLPYSQVGRSPQSLVVRTTGDPRPLLRAITARIHQIDPATPIAHLESLEAVVARSIAPERFRGALLSALAAIAVVLVMFGVWSVTMCTVARQERENGIRLALGEPTTALQRRLLTSALRPAVIGAVAGVALAAGAARWVQAFLFGIDARDPVLLTSAGIGLVLLAAAAAWIPARRAARIDPALALRVD
jgi:predicted permease